MTSHCAAVAGCLLALLAGSTGTAIAQGSNSGFLEEVPTGPLTPSQPVACKPTITARASAGLAQIDVDDPCTHGPTITISYQNELFVFPYDGATNKAQAQISLFAEQNQILVDPGDGKAAAVQVAFPEFRIMFKIALSWQAPVDLNLHVLEPFAVLGSAAGHIHAGNANRTRDHGKGVLDLVHGGQAATHVQDYALPQPQLDFASGQLIGVRVEYASRGAQPQGDYCGKGRLASVPFRLRILNHGRVRDTVDSLSFAPAPCGEEIERDGVFKRVLWRDPPL